MSEECSQWLTKLKNKYRSEIDKLQVEESQYLITNYRFEGSTLLYIFTVPIQSYDLTILIVNHNSIHKETCKYIVLNSDLHNNIKNIIKTIEFKIDAIEELQSIKLELLKYFNNKLNKKIKSLGKGKYLGGGTIARDSWYRFEFEGRLEDISIENFFSDAIKEAKNMYQRKCQLNKDIEKRNLSMKSIKLLDISNDKVRQFLLKVKNDLEKIKGILPDDLIKAFANRSIIIENGALEKFGFIAGKSETCKLFGEIIPIKSFTIQAELDSRRFEIYIRGLYGFLIEEVLQTYIHNIEEIEFYILKKLNEFIECYKTGKIPYNIQLPLNGIIADLEETNNLRKIPISKNAGLNLFDDVVVITKSTNLILNRSAHYHRDSDNSKGNIRAISIYCEGNINFKFIEKTSYFFSFDISEPESINKNEVWSEIRNIFSALILSNFKIGFSKQFYTFPWWIPKKRYNFDFPYPDWLRNVPYFNPTEKISVDWMNELKVKYLVPSSYRKITIITPIEKDEARSITQDNIANGLGFFRIVQGRQYEMGFQERNLKIPSDEFLILKRVFDMYSNNKNPINFDSSKFLIKQLIRLRLREKIEDAILDSCLILESLLIKRKEELSYQFRLHGSLLISHNISELKANIDFLKDLYSLRSEIVHGEEDWHEFYRKFRNKHFKIKYSKKEWNLDKVEYTRDSFLDLIFEKILQVLWRINEIGLNLDEIKEPYNLIAKLKFNPLETNLEEKKNSRFENAADSQKSKQNMILKKLARYNEKLTSIINFEKLVPPDWYRNFKVAINMLKLDKFEDFLKLFCSINFIQWEFKSKKKVIIESIVQNLKKIKDEICLNNKIT